MDASAQILKIRVDPQREVSGLLQNPTGHVCYVLAHGAGAGMRHPFLSAVARGLAARGLATLRYQFPYMEQGLKRPDPPAVARLTCRAAVSEAQRLLPGIPLFAGGKSFGGRMTSQAQAEEPLPGVRGLLFLGFPLHPAGQPSDERAKHLSDIEIPMLFIQGTRDKLADLDLLQGVIEQLGSRATLKLIEAADHSFHAPARSGHTPSAIEAEILDSVRDWIADILSKEATQLSNAAPVNP